MLDSQFPYLNRYSVGFSEALLSPSASTDLITCPETQYPHRLLIFGAHYLVLDDIMDCAVELDMSQSLTKKR